jgi:hypothetical protein
MTKQNMYYRVMAVRSSDHEIFHRSEAPALPRTDKTTPKPTIKIVETKSEEKAGGATKVCSGHLGKQLSAVRKDGRPYSCGYGKDCTFSHLSIVGKSDQKLLEIAASMPRTRHHENN